MTLSTLPLIARSHVEHGSTHYGLIRTVSGDKKLAVSGDVSGFTGKMDAGTGALIAPLTPENARKLRQRLPWLRPVALGTRTSAGFGDRLGCATVGHLMATVDSGVAPILAQQSVRENTRTGRTPRNVLDDAMWGAFEFGWRAGWGADADHLKTLDDIAPFVAAGYTFYTIDPGDHVDDDTAADDLPTLRRKVAELDWHTLDSTPDDLLRRLSGTRTLDGLTLELSEESLLRAAAKYGAAIVHTVRMEERIRELIAGQPFDLEVSVDETGTTTSHVEHFVIASELMRLGVVFASLAPRFVGRFEKGVDYIGDLAELEQDIAGHAAIMRHFDNRYKLSLHTGSDKFGVYPLALRHTGGRVHLKTAGTSYLEALRVMASVDATLFRRVLDFSRECYEEDRRTYHVSAQLGRVPAADNLTDADLLDLLDQFDARQVLHVTFGSVLDHFGAELADLLKRHEADYHVGLKRHFARHLRAFREVNHV